MDSNLQSSPSDSAGAKGAFRKPLNDAANRKYRRRSPVSRSSSSDGSSNHERSSSPTLSREDPAKVFDDHRRKDDGRDLDSNYGRSRYGRSGDSYRYFGQQSSRSSHNYHSHDHYVRREKYTDEEETNFSKLSSRSDKELRVGHSDHTRRDFEHNRSRDHLRSVDKYSRDKSDVSGHRSRDKDREASSLEYKKYKEQDLSSDRAGSGRKSTNFNIEEVREWDTHKGDGDGRDEKRDYRRSFGDRKSDRSPTYEEYRGHRNDSTSRRDSSGHRLKESSRSDPMELDGQRYSKEEKKKYDDRETNRHKERYNREPGEQFEDGYAFSSEDQESLAKKPKLFSLDRGTDCGKDVSKFTTVTDERQSSCSKQALEFVGKVTSEQDYVKDSDIDAAKVAAMKAAELVNRNLVGTGFMSTDQKKKLLWGNKKNSAAEQSVQRWDTSLFSDRERQEKFNKLMSLRLCWYRLPIVGCEGRAESGAQTRQPRWQWTSPSREAEGTPAGFGEAIHCRTPSKRWTYCWTRSLRIYFESTFRYLLLYNCARNMFLVNFTLDSWGSMCLLCESRDYGI